MTAEATFLNDADTVNLTATVALASGEVIQVPDGRAGVVQGLAGIAAGAQASVLVRGVVTVAKTTAINILAGGRVYWDRSAGKAHFRPQSGDFYMGTVYEDSLAAATTVTVVLNEKQRNLVEFDGAPNGTLWTLGATLGLGVTAATPAARTILAFDAVAEAAMAAMYPANAVDHAPLADGPICEMKVAVFDIGDNAALDINFGIANESHATDFDTVAEQVTFHLDGTALAINAESDDGTTEVASTDTTVVAVDDTYFEIWIDARNPADVQLYIDGVNVLPASVFNIAAATGPLFPIVYMEKTSNATPADLRVEFVRMRTCDDG